MNTTPDQSTGRVAVITGLNPLHGLGSATSCEHRRLCVRLSQAWNEQASARARGHCFMLAHDANMRICALRLTCPLT